MARRSRDELKSELDRLALRLVKDANTASVRDRTAALKVAASWYGISRKGQKPEEGPNAWDQYRDSLNGGEGAEDVPEAD